MGDEHVRTLNVLGRHLIHEFDLRPIMHALVLHVHLPPGGGCGRRFGQLLLPPLFPLPPPCHLVAGLENTLRLIGKVEEPEVPAPRPLPPVELHHRYQVLEVPAQLRHHGVEHQLEGHTRVPPRPLLRQHLQQWCWPHGGWCGTVVLPGVHLVVHHTSRLGGGGRGEGGCSGASPCTSSRTSPPPALAILCPRGAEWFWYVARAAATDCCSCRHHERSRRCCAAKRHHLQWAAR